MSSKDYHYEGFEYPCAYSSSKVVNQMVNAKTPFVDINAGDIDTFKARLAKGPVAVAVNANHIYFQHYDEGMVPDDGTCGTQLDHAILAVGFGVEVARKYVVFKNSWGKDWGDRGFIRLEYGRGKREGGGTTSACGFLEQASQVVLDV